MTIPEAIQKELDDASHLTPEEINQGSCMNVAMNVRSKSKMAMFFGDPRVLPPHVDIPSERRVVGCGHVWVTDGAKHYDAQAPQGVSKWQDLPYFL